MKRIASFLMTPGVATHEVGLAVCSTVSGVIAGAAVSVAPCFFQLPADTGTDASLVEIQVTPVGSFRPRDNRPMPVDAWKIDAAIAARVIERFRANKTPLVVDYEHQTLLADDNGLPAPAAGWIRDLEWREGQGLFARVELTARARAYVAAGEYRYFSPVLVFDKNTGEIAALLMGALTNNPALDGMAPIELRAAARFNLNEEPAMNKHLLAIALACAIATTNLTEDQVGEAALKKIKELQAAGDLAALRQQLSLGADVGVEEIGTAIAALKTQATAAGTGQPDPAQYVPIAAVSQLQEQVAALTAQNIGREVDALIAPALEDGRLLGALEPWARDLGKKDIAALKSYLDNAQPIAALSGTQTDGKTPAGGKDENGLTAPELAVCAMTGVSPKDFAAAKAAKQPATA